MVTPEERLQALYVTLGMLQMMQGRKVSFVSGKDLTLEYNLSDEDIWNQSQVWFQFFIWIVQSFVSLWIILWFLSTACY